MDLFKEFIYIFLKQILNCLKWFNVYMYSDQNPLNLKLFLDLIKKKTIV